jgi:predicted AlkP superfamily pyrophosphatase or phosphodiesterase
MQSHGSRRCLSILIAAGCVYGADKVWGEEVAARPRRVVVVVWDGMRPDMVTEKNTPTLWKLAQAGVVFRNHHSVYPSATNVNGTALVTGVYPGRSGILANHEYRPEIDERNGVDIENPAVVRKGDDISGGKYIGVPTIVELLRAAGRRTTIATAKTVGLLLADGRVRPTGGQDRHPFDSAALRSGQVLDAARDKNSVALFSGQMQSAAALARIVSLLGPFPLLNFAQKDSWTTKALIDVFWKEGVTDFSLLWLSEPDGTEHETAPGSPAALAAIKSADDNLARVLAELDRSRRGGTRSTTDVFIVSDHGFSTIERSVDLRKSLRAAGFDAVTEFASKPNRGQIMAAGNGGTVLFYVVEHDPAVTRRLVEFLQQSDFAGVIFTREKLPGTFNFADAKIDNPHSADVVMAFRWNEQQNQFGVPGMIDADWNRKAGQGTHATLSRFDMHNMLVASGPDFHHGQTDNLPSGNIDLTPTILRIFGIKPADPLDGRVLTEAMSGAGVSSNSETNTIEATKTFALGTWRQSLRISRVGSTIYLDEGNGSFLPEKK